MEKINGIIKTIGGALIILQLILFIAFIWVDNYILVTKLIASNFVLILFIYLSDKVTEDD